MKNFGKDHEGTSMDVNSSGKPARARMDHFSFLAPFYEFFIPPGNQPEFLEMVDLPVGGVLLDVGGGTGRVAQFFRENARLIVVADESRSMIQEAFKKSGLHGVCAAAEYLPFAPGTYERVLMVDAIHHVANQAATCAELVRVLRPGGRIVIEEPDIRRFGVKLIALAEKLALMRSHFLTPSRITDLFKAANTRSRVILKEATAWIIIDKGMR